MCDYLALGTTASFKMRSDVPGSVFFVRESVHARACVRAHEDAIRELCHTQVTCGLARCQPGSGKGTSTPDSLPFLRKRAGNLQRLASKPEALRFLRALRAG